MRFPVAPAFKHAGNQNSCCCLLLQLVLVGVRAGPWGWKRTVQCLAWWLIHGVGHCPCTCFTKVCVPWFCKPICKQCTCFPYINSQSWYQQKLELQEYHPGENCIAVTPLAAVSELHPLTWWICLFLSILVVVNRRIKEITTHAPDHAALKSLLLFKWTRAH